MKNKQDETAPLGWGEDDWYYGRYGPDESVESEFGDIDDMLESSPEPIEEPVEDGWIVVENESDKIVVDDIIRFSEFVWNKDFRKKEIIGNRTNEIKVSKVVFDKNLCERVYFEVLESEGDHPYPIEKSTWHKKDSIKRGRCCRKLWDDESQREKALEVLEAEYQGLLAEWSKQEALKREAELEDIFESNSVAVTSYKEDRKKNTIADLSDDEQQWLLTGWHKDAVLDKSTKDKFGQWNPELGWKQLHDSDDAIVVGDIILYWHPLFSGRYPHGKFLGTSMVIAKVVRLGRKYCYCECLRSFDDLFNEGDSIRVSFDNVNYWGTYRLYWGNEYLRMKEFESKYKLSFNSIEKYNGYIKVQESDSSDEPEDNINDNNVNVEKEIKMIENLDVEQLNSHIKNGRNLYINRDGYYKLSGGREPMPIQISNFILIPASKIVQGGKWWFECKVIHSHENIEDTIILSRDDFRSGGKFKRALSFDSRLEYYGNGQDTTQLQGLMTDYRPPLKAGTDKMGLHRIDGKWVYVEGHEVVDNDGPTDKIVYTNNDLSDDMPCILAQPDISQENLELIAANLNQFNDPSIAYLVLGWVGFCFVKERLAEKVNKRNPILLCQGEPGSGKTETITRIIQRIFANPHPVTNTADATKFTFAVNGSWSNMVPFHYDEWKKSVMQGWQVKNLESMLLAVFNQTTLPRGCTNQSVNDYRFTAPLVISGEMTLESPSLRHRIFDVFFSKRKREGRTEHFKQLCELPLGSFGKGLLMHMLSISDDKLLSSFDWQKKLVDSRVDDRFEDNAALVRTGLWLIIDYLQAHGIDTSSYDEGYGAIDKAIVEMMTSARETNVDRIISDFSHMSKTPNGSGNWLNAGVHYEVRDGIIAIKIAEAYSRYLRYAKRHETRSEPLGKHSLLQQIECKSYYIGKKTVRIGGKPCNAICLDSTAMPDFIEADFAA